MTAPMPPLAMPTDPNQGPPTDAMPTPPKPPWTPFQTRPNDDEPGVAAIWARKLSNIISTVEYAEADPAWREPLDAKYKAAITALTPPPMPPENAGKPGPKPAGMPQ